jgi:hypothetical protein
MNSHSSYFDPSPCYYHWLPYKKLNQKSNKVILSVEGFITPFQLYHIIKCEDKIMNKTTFLSGLFHITIS